MTDWNKPTITSNYITFVDEVKARDVDAITLQLNAITNPPTGAVKLSRSPVKFQEWDGTQFVDRILSVAGGGTGSNSLSNLGPAMGLGTMAYQNANAIAVTGGTIAAVTSTNLVLNGNVTGNGSLVFTGPLALTGVITVDNSSTNATAVRVTQPRNQLFAGEFISSSTIQSYGLRVQAGNDSGDIAFQVINRQGTVNYMHLRGDGLLQIPFFLKIPVGSNRYVSS